MARPLLDDALWARIEPLLPAPRARRADHPGRRPLGARQVLTGILFVLKTGIAWRDLPCELGCGSGMSCLRYLRAWRHAGVWPQVVEVLRAGLAWADQADWSRLEAGGEPDQGHGHGPEELRGPKRRRPTAGPDAATPEPPSESRQT